MRPFVILLISWNSHPHPFSEGFVVHTRVGLIFFLPSSSNGWPGPFGPQHWWQPRHLQPLTGNTPSVYWNTLWANPNKWVSLSLPLFLSYRCFSQQRARLHVVLKPSFMFLSQKPHCFLPLTRLLMLSSLVASSISVQLSNEEFAVSFPSQNTTAKISWLPDNSPVHPSF